MNRVVHFEIHAENPERAAAFYKALFAWNIQKWNGPADYWMVMTGAKDQPGIDGGLMRRHGPPPADMQAVNAYVCTVEVDNVDAMLEKALKLGGTLALAKMPIPGIGWLAYAKDTEGNIFGMLQNDPKAGT